MSDAVLTETVGRLGRIRLNRPKAINALTYEMIGAVGHALETFIADPEVGAILLTGEGERGFCAGGDVRALYAATDLGPAEAFWRDEYRLDVRIARCPKPVVAIMDGLTMGGGVGLTAHASHRVVTERSLVAMPETGIGYLPDVGTTFLLPRAPGEVGTYLGLSGAPMVAADAIYAGFADWLVMSQALPGLVDALAGLPEGASTKEVTAAIRSFAHDSAPNLAQHRATIDRCFAFDQVEEIVAALAADGSTFANETMALLASKAPSALVLTLILLRLGRNATTLEQCLEREYNASLSVLAEGDFREGVRAALIDKDRTPRWMFPTLADVDHARVARWIEPRAAPVFAAEHATTGP